MFIFYFNTRNCNDTFFIVGKKYFYQVNRLEYLTFAVILHFHSQMWQ
jgi:hypothetical protein